IKRPARVRRRCSWQSLKEEEEKKNRQLAIDIKLQSIMKLEHIAITVSEPADIKDFYFDILGMKEVKNFVLNKVLANKIFSINNETSVYLLQKDDISLEIFILPGQNKHSFEHICLAVKDREKLVENSLKHNYECIRIERDLFDLVFIKDRSGNVFEIKKNS
ncbi:MAG: VOC family protein, partial [Bacteroidales bacterium]|nr:VOC family protein [Bacteroidales bacterium]